MFRYFQRSTSPNLLGLLRSVSEDRALPTLSPLKDRQVKWIIEAGLGPLVWFASQKDSGTADSPLLIDLKAADLTTRLINRIQLETLGEILGRCVGLMPPITLLKGSSMKRSPRQIRWDAIFNWVQASVAGTHLYLVLSYLHKNKIIDLDNKILADLFARQRSFGTINLKIAHSLITRYVVAGKIPISGWRLSAFWQNLLLDHGAALNLVFATKSIMPSFGFRRATLS
jgi:hypothetical protein